MPKTTEKKRSAIDEFIALPDDEKEKIWDSFNRIIPESETQPLSPHEESEWRAFQRAAKAKARRGRPKVGQGAKRVQVTVEGTLLKQADAYASKHGLTRAQLVARGLKLAIGK